MSDDKWHDKFLTHQVDLNITLAELPFPVSGRMVGGSYRLAADAAYFAFSDGCNQREYALTELMRGLEQLVRTTEDKIRADWGMETRQQKARREYEEKRRIWTSRMFANDYGQPLEVFSTGGPKFLFGKTKVEDEDYPLGEVPAL